VIGQRRSHLVNAAAVKLLERTRSREVKVAALTREQTVVSHVLGERMPEDEHLFVAAGFFKKELEPAQLFQLRCYPLRPAPHPGQKAEPHLAAQHCRRLQELLGGIRQPIDPRHDDAMHGVGDTVVRPVFEDGASQLFEEERVTLGLGEDLGGHLGRNARLPRDRANQRLAVGDRERSQR
jgi:hypothetical protein